ncbi:hypothetical protein NB311A_12262 [Nitrobacter sp. Nb-311A]|nr:hypothetical protein NB311A_12262 [Nitrobacter sp. Nb-311A]
MIGLATGKGMGFLKFEDGAWRAARSCEAPDVTG